MVSVALGDVAEVISGVGFPKKLQGSSDGEVPVFKVGDISNAIKNGTHFLRKSSNNLSKADAHKLSKTLMPTGTIVFAKIGEGLKLNRRAVLSQPSLVDNNVMGLAPKAGVATSSYLYYFMQTVDLGTLSRATAVPSVRKSDVVELPVPLLPLAQQNEIVAEIEKQFSRLDEAVASLQRVKANLNRYKASVLKDAVEGRLVPTEAELARREGRSFETGQQLLKRILEMRRTEWNGQGKFKESASPVAANLPSLPAGWTWATMPQLGELNRGKSKHRPRDDAALYGGPYPFIQTGDVRRSDGSITAHSQTYSEVGLQQSRLWPVGTLCITIAANIAETGILKLEACFPDSVVGFVASQGYPTTEYVEFFIRTARDGLDRFASATAQKNINLEVLTAVAVPTPPLAEQHRIVAEVDRRLSLVRGVETEVDANLKRAQALRQSMLRSVFSLPK